MDIVNILGFWGVEYSVSKVGNPEQEWGLKKVGMEAGKMRDTCLMGVPGITLYPKPWTQNPVP